MEQVIIRFFIVENENMLGYILYKLKLKTILIIISVLITLYFILQVFLSSFSNKKLPIIIWWTPFMGDERIINCFNQYNCLLTKDKNYYNSTNLKAFLFYGSQFDIKDLPLPKKEIWAIFHEESPRNVALFLHNRTYELFEIVSTFSRHSDFPLTLQYLENLSIITDTQHVVPLQEKNELLNEIAPVLYIQSDCDTPVERDAYVSELMKHIQVDSYGACLNNKKFPKEISEIYSLDLYNTKFLKFIARYKFVIAFENAICDDYITEKLWRPLMVGSIPIYMGSPSVEDWLPNKNSAVLAKNFQPRQLAEYIEKINKNDTLYELHQEHKHGKVENNKLKDCLDRGPFGILTEQEHPISAFECFVCRGVHEGVRRRKEKSVYDCPKPKPGNVWEYHWYLGDCQSEALVKSVENNVKLQADPC